jgi:hypothetical protein
MHRLIKKGSLRDRKQNHNDLSNFRKKKTAASSYLTAAYSSGRYRQFLAEDTSIARKTANHYIDLSPILG